MTLTMGVITGTEVAMFPTTSVTIGTELAKMMAVPPYRDRVAIAYTCAALAAAPPAPGAVTLDWRIAPRRLC